MRYLFFILLVWLLSILSCRPADGGGASDRQTTQENHLSELQVSTLSFWADAQFLLQIV